MSLYETRIPPLPMDQWGDEEKQAMAVFARPSKKGLQSNVDKKDQDLSALGMLLNYPSLAKAYIPYSAFLLEDGVLCDRDRELLILRVAWRRKSEYEWAQHLLICEPAGITEEEIARVSKGADAEGWSEQERLLMAAVDDLLDDCRISDETWAGLDTYYDPQMLMEIIFVVGTYDLVAMAFNTTGIPLNHNLRAMVDRFPLE